jgi:hypothetical protein
MKNSQGWLAAARADHGTRTETADLKLMVVDGHLEQWNSPPARLPIKAVRGTRIGQEFRRG